MNHLSRDHRFWMKIVTPKPGQKYLLVRSGGPMERTGLWKAILSLTTMNMAKKVALLARTAPLAKMIHEGTAFPVKTTAHSVVLFARHRIQQRHWDLMGTSQCPFRSTMSFPYFQIQQLMVFQIICIMVQCSINRLVFI